MTLMRAWDGPADTAAIQDLASRLWPAGLHPGGLGWSWATEQLGNELVIIEDEQQQLVGWAGVSQPGELAFGVDPERLDVVERLVDWMLRTATGPELTVDAYEQRTREALRSRGFASVDPPFGFYRMGTPGLRAGTSQIAGALPKGYRIDDVRSVGAHERVEAHRIAWRPADLPFADGQAPYLDPAATSSFTLRSYERVRSAALYNPSLDLVVVAPDGSLAGCCIGWFDSRTGWAEIEPLGVVPGHLRRGLAVAMCAAVANRITLTGGHHVFINTANSDFYPAPYAAYVKAGFTPFPRSTAMRRSQPGRHLDRQ